MELPASPGCQRYLQVRATRFSPDSSTTLGNCVAAAGLFSQRDTWFPPPMVPFLWEFILVHELGRKHCIFSRQKNSDLMVSHISEQASSR